MKLRLSTTCAGPSGSYQPGDHDIPEPLASELIEGGYAVSLDMTEAKEDKRKKNAPKNEPKNEPPAV